MPHADANQDHRTTDPTEPGVNDQSRKSAVAAFLGATLEYYDFFIYASAAALVFPKLFFPDAGTRGVLLSLATFGVAYVARPVGGLVLGHLGDWFGRKRVLIITLILMGGATFAIGCLPTYDSIGHWAPILLVAFRLLQGFSVGGEAAGATTLTLEHSPVGRRAFFTSWTMTGIWMGYIIAAGLNIALNGLLTDEQMYTWGWRLPFWLSAIICVVAYIFRRTLDEPEAFIQVEANTTHTAADVPVRELLRTHLGELVLVIISSFLIVISASVPLWGLSYAVNSQGISAGTTLAVIIVGYAGSMLFQPFYALLADRIGRRPVMIYGNLGGAASCFLFFYATAAKNVPLMFLGMFLSISVFFSAANAVYPAFFSEKFNVRVRFSGMAIGLQLGILLTGFSPAILTALTDAAQSWWPAAVFTASALLISSVAIAASRETYKVPLHDLGRSMEAVSIRA